MRLQTHPFERRLSEPENAASLTLGDDQSEPFFYKRLQPGFLLGGYSTCVFKKAIRYMYGGFHVEGPVTEHGKMSYQFAIILVRQAAYLFRCERQA
jgi:hypothetical protein